MSATPFAEVTAPYHNKKIVTLDVADNYYGIKEMLNRTSLVCDIDSVSVLNETIAENITKEKVIDF